MTKLGGLFMCCAWQMEDEKFCLWVCEFVCELVCEQDNSKTWTNFDEIFRICLKR